MMTQYKEVFEPDIAIAIADFIVDKKYNEDMSDDAARAYLVATHLHGTAEFKEGGKYAILRNVPNESIMGAMIRGYEAEKSKEEKLLDFYKKRTDIDRYGHATALAVKVTVEETLKILGIKIGGINE